MDFLESTQRDEFNGIENDNIRTYHYRDLLWSDDFYVLGIIVVTKIPMGKSDTPLQFLIGMR